MICQECGKEFNARPRMKYCDDCRHRVSLRQKKESFQANYGNPKAVETIDHPRCCGVKMDNLGLYWGCAINDKHILAKVGE